MKEWQRSLILLGLLLVCLAVLGWMNHQYQVNFLQSL